jgi:hypothetical protein
MFDDMNLVVPGAKASTAYVAEGISHFHPNGERCECWGRADLCGVREHMPVTMWTERFHNIVTTVGLNALLDNTFSAAAGSVAWSVFLIGAGTGTVSETAAANAVTGSGTTFDAGLAVSPIADIIIVGAGTAGVDLVTTVASRSSNTAVTTTANAATTVAGVAFATEPIAADTMSSHINSWTENTSYSEGTRQTWTKNAVASGGAMSNSSAKAVFSINAANVRIFGAGLCSNSTKGGTTGTLYGGGLFTAASRLLQSGDTLSIQIDPSLTAS